MIRDLKKRYEAEGAKYYRGAYKSIQEAVKKAKENWIGTQCENIETCLNKDNSKEAYQLVKALTSEKQARSSSSRAGMGNVLPKNKRFSADGQNIAQDYTNIS